MMREKALFVCVYMADTQTIKDRIDIVQLIQEYVPLKKAGVNYRANCPFHQEKTPSFMVHPDKQIWHCFGCGKGGDIFSFIREIEGLEFIEALKLLAARAGVKIDTYQSEVNQSQRNRLLEITEAGAIFFHRFLMEMPGAQVARDYLAKRGLKAQTIDEWQIGYIPDQWDLLTKYLLTKGFGIDDLIASGLTIKRDGADVKSGKGVYDRFRGRIMFPISDAHGGAVGFTGRVLIETEQSGGKYINTPQTIIYDKSRILYGLHLAKTEIKNKDLAVVVEGQLDVISSHQAGMKNVVAASGTALTIEQIKLIKRYTNNVAMAFDADAAGESAGKRGIAVAMEQGLNVKVIQLPKGFAKDADECIKKDPTVWFKAISEAKAVMDWYFANILNRYNLTNPKEKREAANILLTEIVRIPHAIERDDWLKKLGVELSIDAGILREEIRQVGRRSAMSLSSRSTRESSENTLPENRLAVLINEFWSLLLKFPDLYGGLKDDLREELFVGTPLVNLYVECKNLYNTVGRLEAEALRQFYDKQEKENFVDVLLLRPYKNFVDLTEAGAARELAAILNNIKQEWRRAKRVELQAELAKAEQIGDKAKAELLVKELLII